mmetsp:Transcript_35724/g.58300  ORF Transcript_35724/g.58300 Transcript_35724/m.58300 type:complete len:99 (+) Transcript_35724:257-553(+)
MLRQSQAYPFQAGNLPRVPKQTIYTTFAGPALQGTVLLQANATLACTTQHLFPNHNGPTGHLSFCATQTVVKKQWSDKVVVLQTKVWIAQGDRGGGGP